MNFRVNGPGSGLCALGSGWYVTLGGVCGENAVGSTGGCGHIGDWDKGCRLQVVVF